MGRKKPEEIVGHDIDGPRDVSAVAFGLHGDRREMRFEIPHRRFDDGVRDAPRSVIEIAQLLFHLDTHRRDGAHVAVDHARVHARHPRFQPAELAYQFPDVVGAAFDRDFCSSVGHGDIIACRRDYVSGVASAAPGAVNAPRRQRSGVPRSARG